MTKYPKYLTVGELKKILSTIDDNLPVGRVGWFGEFREMSAYNISVTEACPVPEGKTWRYQDPKPIKVLQIVSPDIGEGPD